MSLGNLRGSHEDRLRHDDVGADFTCFVSTGLRDTDLRAFSRCEKVSDFNDPP